MWEAWINGASYPDPIHIWRRREKVTSINAIGTVRKSYQRIHGPYYYY
jgi:hypothetical protein